MSEVNNELVSQTLLNARARCAPLWFDDTAAGVSATAIAVWTSWSWFEETTPWHMIGVRYIPFPKLKHNWISVLGGLSCAEMLKYASQMTLQKFLQPRVRQNSVRICHQNRPTDIVSYNLKLKAYTEYKHIINLNTVIVMTLSINEHCTCKPNTSHNEFFARSIDHWRQMTKMSCSR